MTKIKNADTPANPTHYLSFTNAHGGQDEFHSDNEGLTKREAFAMAAMQGLCAEQYSLTNTNSARENLAKEAVGMADALLNELSKELK